MKLTIATAICILGITVGAIVAGIFIEHYLMPVTPMVYELGK